MNDVQYLVTVVEFDVTADINLYKIFWKSIVKI